ncbi:MAG: alpha/beta hydrolase-fold protein [Acidimicrobiales bacterium]|jgi:enterochelin esterase family protein
MIVHSRIEGSNLVGNLLGDPSERDLFVYLPPGYEDSGQRYRTAYLLHAFGSSAAKLVQPDLDRQRWVPPLEDVLDPVFGRLGVEPLVVVIPDGWTSYGCGQWVDSPVCGNFEQYVLHDVVGYVDGHYRTIPEPRSRGVFGFSSGGSGAWNLASRNPDTFAAMAMLSGDSFLDMTHKTYLYDYLDSIWPEAPNGPVEGNDLSKTVYAYSACYSPNPNKPPFYVDLPVRYPSGELIEDVWDRWLSFDPVVNWREREGNLRRLSGILLDVGSNDDYHLQWGHRLLSHYLSEAEIVHESTENAGNHGGRSRERFQVALRFLAQALEGT